MTHHGIILLAVILAAIGAIVTKNLVLLAIGWGLLILPLTKIVGILKRHLNFIVVFVLPLFVYLFVVWHFIIGAPPDRLIGSDPDGGTIYSLTTAIRLMVLGGLAQIAFLPIPLDDLPYVLTQVGIKGDLLVIIISSFALIPEFSQRANKIITARYARGLIKDRSFCSRLIQLPYLIRPLFTGALKTAENREKIWERWGHIESFNLLAQSPKKAPKPISFLYLAAALGWLSLAVVLK
jgi:energy-coupling factor transporter transmembrane protein EcfT